MLSYQSMSEKQSTYSALKLSFELGYTIAIPIVVLALVGRLLDKKFETSPWLLIAGILLSLVVASVGLVVKFGKILASMRLEEKNEQKDKDSEKQKNSYEEQQHT